MARLSNKLLIIALYIVTWAGTLPTTVGTVSMCGSQNHTDASLLTVGSPDLSRDAIVNGNTKVKSDLSARKLCCLDAPRCDTTAGFLQVSGCFDGERHSSALGCDAPGLRVSTTSTSAYPPAQTCVTSLIAVGTSATFNTFANFHTKTRLVKDRQEATMSFPILDPDPGPSPVPDSDVDSDLSVTVTMTMSNEPTITIISTSQHLSSLLTSTSTAASGSPTSAQSKPTSANSGSTPGAQSPNQTAIIIGGIAGTLAALAILIVALDHLVKRMRRHRRRSTSENSDDAILAQDKEEQQVAYGYYGTNRAGIILKGMRVFKANTEPAELPAESIAADRE